MLTETLLEMHFFSLIREALEDVYGARVLQILKPSTRAEAWFGFDQGYVLEPDGHLPARKGIQEWLHGSVRDGAVFYVGYFLQFKVVSRLERRSRYTPSGFVTPYLRSEISLEPNRTTGLSQHETLQRLAGMPNSSVYYACPMVFTGDELWAPPAVDQLRLVDVRSSPAHLAVPDRHFIAFRRPDDPSPVWCSEPTAATTRSVATWLQDPEQRPTRLRPDDVSAYLDSLRGALVEESPTGWDEGAAVRLPTSFSLIELQSSGVV